MKTLTSIASTFALMLTAITTQANNVFEDYAKVTRVTPQFEKVNLPRKECFSEVVPERKSPRRSLAGPLIGGIAGGILGAQVGSGNGRVAASAAGAAIGAVVGDRMSHKSSNEYYEREVRRCRLVDHWENRLVGYEIAYRYRGHAQTVILPHDPGRRLPLRVAIEPILPTEDMDDWAP